MWRVVTLFAWLTVLAINGLAQAENRPQPDGFRGLILDQTTAEDAIRIIGQPAKEEVDRLEVSELGKWLDAKYKEKIFRQLTFKKVGDFHEIRLSFLENKLVMVALDFDKDLEPPKLKNLFGVEFSPVDYGMGLRDKPEQQPQRLFFARSYPRSYTAVAISDRSFLYAKCSSHNIGVPGRVDKVFQVSRALEKR
jgi:hypothetical protein